MKVLAALFSILLLATCSVLAADPPVEPIDPATNSQENPQPEAVELEVNLAEIQALRTGDLESGEGVLYQRNEESGALEPRAALSPMMQDIMAVLETEKESMAQLQARFDAAVDEREALVIQREMEDLVQGSERSILQIQADYARAGGREEIAQKIEAAIDEMDNPQPVKAPEQRPAPTGRR